MHTSRASFVCGCWVSEPSASCLLSNYASPSSFLKTNYTIHVVIGGHLLNRAQEYSIITLILSVFLSLLLSRCWIVLDLVKMFWGTYNRQKFIFIAECRFGNYCCHLWLAWLNSHSRDMARPPLASFLFADLWMMLFVVGSMFCATRKYFWEGRLESYFLYVVVSCVVYFRNSF